MTEVRRLRRSDFEAVYLLGAEMWREGLFRVVEYDRGKMFEFLTPYVEESEVNYGVVAYRGDELVGFFMGHVSEYFFGRDLIASEVLWYVARPVRGGILGVRLLRGFEDWARGLGVSEVSVGISTGIAQDRTGDLLGRRGYVHAGGIYKLPVVV